MLLNNNWKYDKDRQYWSPASTGINKTDFDLLKEDLKTLRLYQKCLSGSTYTSLIQLNKSIDRIEIDNIYPILDYQTIGTPYYMGIPYIEPSVPPTHSPMPIQPSKMEMELYEYSNTLKNLFTPDRLVNDQKTNMKYVDVASIESIDLDIIHNDLEIDGVRVRNGHRILIKDQFINVTLPNTTDPDTFFIGEYTIDDNDGINTTYKVFLPTNGIYTYTNRRLVRTTDLDTYGDLKNHTVVVKDGLINKNKKYVLQKLLSGKLAQWNSLDNLYFASTIIGDSIVFKPTDVYVLRNRIDYNNLFELVLSDTLKHATQSITHTIQSSTQSGNINYTIPERTIVVGEFGSILIHQEGFTNIIDSKWKAQYNSITEAGNYYWVCGDEGMLLKISKSDLSIKRVFLTNDNTTIETKLMSISFFDSLRGVVVGKFNQLWVTEDGGNTWTRLEFNGYEGFNYNQVLYPMIDTFYVGGDNGLFIEFKYSMGVWSAYKRRISKYVDGYDDEFLYVEHIKDMIHFEHLGNRYIAICGELGTLWLYDIQNVLGQFSQFICLVDTTNIQTDFTAVTWTNGLYITTFDRFYFVDPFNIIMQPNTNIGIVSYIDLGTIAGINALYSYNNDIIAAGNFTKWEITPASITPTFLDVYDNGFLDRLKPKLLFMDYDIGSKLYWFDDFGQYRLPERLIIPSNNLLLSSTSSSYIAFNKPTSDLYDSTLGITVSYTEEHWIGYWKDRHKTFEYYSTLDQSTIVEPSFTFSSSNLVGQPIIYATASITTNYNDIINLMPNAVIYGEARGLDSSRFREISGIPITEPTNIIDIYFYDYLGVWRISGTQGLPDVGDVIEISSDIFTGKFVINKWVSFPSGNYYYFYTDFNQNIIDNLFSSTTGFSIRDLNKYLPMLGTTASTYFVNNLNDHYLGLSYDTELREMDTPSGLTDSFTITGKYSQWSAYYNLQSTVDSLLVSGSTWQDEIYYPNGLLRFGYKPTYNLLNYMNSIDREEWSPDRVFHTLPRWINIPGPQLIPGDIDNQVFIDTGLETNKIIFGINLKYIWESLLIWTFIDVRIDGPGTNSNRFTYKLLIIDKKELSDGRYMIEFHDKIDYTVSGSINTIDLLSRRTLSEISDDLQYMNRLHRPMDQMSSSWDKTSSNIVGTWNNLETKIGFKVPTDSYTKVLLSDVRAKSDLSGIIYTDYKGELALQVSKLPKYKVLNITFLGNNGSGFYRLYFNEEHNLETGQYLTIKIDDAITTTYPLNLLGVHYVTYVSATVLDIAVPFVTPTSVSDLVAVIIDRDPFLNFEPIDLFGIGIEDKKIKQSIRIERENYIIDDGYNLLDIDPMKYRFRLIDGLDLLSLNSKFQWILNSEIKDATIGVDKNGELVWYKGVWKCGRWFGGRWVSGTWLSGDWYGGTWTSKEITDNLLSIAIDEKKTNLYSSTWYGGRWFGGNWENGRWYTGRWYGGNWYSGIWYTGIWNLGNWHSGEFKSGIWVDGIWYLGNMNTTNGQTNWLNGEFLGGDFESGIWWNGLFTEKNGNNSRFGTRASNSRPGIWRSGRFTAGEFYSYMDNEKSVSMKHNYSRWLTGKFVGGVFYGGVVFNMNHLSSRWAGGIVDETIINNIEPSDNTLELEGEWPFNINDYIYVVDDGASGTQSFLENPLKLKVLAYTYDPLVDTTVIDVGTDLVNELGTNQTILGTVSNVLGFTTSNLKCVSWFQSSNWESGVWYNGVFIGGVFRNGLFYDGYFEGSWG